MSHFEAVTNNSLHSERNASVGSDFQGSISSLKYLYFTQVLTVKMTTMHRMAAVRTRRGRGFLSTLCYCNHELKFTVDNPQAYVVQNTQLTQQVEHF